jgi:hypothetical protein
MTSGTEGTTSSAIRMGENVVTTTAMTVATTNYIESPEVPAASTTPAVTTTATTRPALLHRPSPSEPPQPRNSVPLFLRWSRLSKTVQVQEANAGLIRRSIAEPSNNQRLQRGGGSSRIRSSSNAGRPIIKPILNQVSGFAAPGQVLALIGPSGSGTYLFHLLLVDFWGEEHKTSVMYMYCIYITYHPSSPTRFSQPFLSLSNSFQYETMKTHFGVPPTPKLVAATHTYRQNHTFGCTQWTDWNR